MSDRLWALLQCFDLRARAVHSGVLCGPVEFDGSAGEDHLHLLRRRPLRVTNPQWRRSVVIEACVLCIPRSGDHQLDGGHASDGDVDG